MPLLATLHHVQCTYGCEASVRHHHFLWRPVLVLDIFHVAIDCPPPRPRALCGAITLRFLLHSNDWNFFFDFVLAALCRFFHCLCLFPMHLLIFVSIAFCICTGCSRAHNFWIYCSNVIQTSVSNGVSAKFAVSSIAIAETGSHSGSLVIAACLARPCVFIQYTG